MPETLKTITAAGLIIIEDGKILLCHETEDWWTLPGGKIEEGENPIEGALREAYEELRVKVEVYDESFTYEVEKEGTKIVLLHFLATRFNKEEEIQKQEDEIEEYGWFGINDLPENTAPNIQPAIQHFTK